MKNKILCLICILTLALTSIVSIKVAFAAAPNTYHFSIDGLDTNDGLTPQTPWKSFSKIKDKILQPGEKVLLKRGDVFSERLEIMGSGKEDNWIEVSAYGDVNLPKPQIKQTNHVDDIAVLVKDFYGTIGNAPTPVDVKYIKINNLNITNTRMGIYIRLIQTSNTGNNKFIEIKDCDFDNINAPAMLEEMNKFVDTEEAKYSEFSVANQIAIGQAIGTKISALLNQSKGNLPRVNVGKYQATGGGGGEYIFPAAIFVGGRKGGIQPEVQGSVENAKPAFQYLAVKNCIMSETIAGVMSWFYAYNGTTGTNAFRETLKYLKVEDVIITGAINGGLAFDSVDGGGIPHSQGVNPSTEGWGTIRNVRVLSGSTKPYATFPNGTTGAIFNNSKNMKVYESEFSGMTNQGNADGCGFDFETNCVDVELTKNVFQNNEGGAILIMDSGTGPHKNLFIHDNLMYKNLQNAFAEGNNRNNNIETKYVHQYNKGNTNVQIYNNTLYMQRYIRSEQLPKYQIKAYGPNNPADNTFSWTNNNVYYYETGVDYKNYKTNYEITLDSNGKATLKDINLHSNIYRAMIIKKDNDLNVAGSIKGSSTNYSSSATPIAFSTNNGYVDIGKLNGIVWNVPYKDIEISIDGGKSGEKYSIEFIPDSKINVSKIDNHKLFIKLEGLSGACFVENLSKEMFTTYGSLLANQVEEAEKIGLFSVILTMKNEISENQDLGINVKNTAFIKIFEDIFAGKTVDGKFVSTSHFSAVDLKMEKMPTKIVYEIGEQLELGGMELFAYDFKEQKTKLTSTKYTVSGFDSITSGKKIITLTHQNLSTSFEIEIKPKTNNGGGIRSGCGMVLKPNIVFGLAIGITICLSLILIKNKKQKSK